MSGHHNFSELRAGMAPERRRRLDAEVAEMQRTYALSQIRRAAGLTQAEVARRLSVTQPTYAADEKGANLRIGTLQRIVAALGGELSFHVELDGCDYPLRLQTAYA